MFEEARLAELIAEKLLCSQRATLEQRTHAVREERMLKLDTEIQKAESHRQVLAELDEKCPQGLPLSDHLNGLNPGAGPIKSQHQQPPPQLLQQMQLLPEVPQQQLPLLPHQEPVSITGRHPLSLSQRKALTLSVLMKLPHASSSRP